VSTVNQIQTAIKEAIQFESNIQERIEGLQIELQEAIDAAKVVSIEDALHTNKIYSVSGIGTVICGKLDDGVGHNIDNRINFGNYFETAQEAKDYAEELRVVNLLNYYAKKFNKGWKPDWNDLTEFKYYITMCGTRHISTKLKIIKAIEFRELITYFKSKKALLQTIKFIGEDKIKAVLERK